MVMASMIILPLIELYIRASPFRIHSPAWRLSLVGNASGAISAPILGLFFMFAIAVAADDKGVSYLVSSLSGLAGVLCLAATGLFALDALQMRNQVQANLSDSYGLASTWIAAKMIISVIVLIALSVSALRAAQGSRRSTQASGKPSSVLVGAAGRPAVGVRPTADAESR
jgi:hypothetical protein